MLNEYVAELTQKIEREKDSLASGSAKTFEEYARKVGLIAGLKMALVTLYALAEKIPKEERPV